MAAQKLTYKKALAELEEILAKIETGEPDIDLLTEQVKRASYLLRFCQERLRKTSAEVDDVLKDLEQDSNT